MSQCAFLEREWAAVYDSAVRAEIAVHRDPRTACFYARRALELAVASRVYTNFEDEMGPETRIALPGLGEGVEFARFRAKAHAYLRAHQDRLAIHKRGQDHEGTKDHEKSILASCFSCAS